MPKFGKRSLEQRATLDNRLQFVLDKVIQHVDFSVLKGKRDKKDQEKAFISGLSKVHWPDSKHNCPIEEPHLSKKDWREDPQGESRAVDIAPYPIDWNDLKQFCFLAGQVVAEGRTQGVILRWGGDWDMDGQGNWRDSGSKFNDLVHFEVVDGRG